MAEYPDKSKINIRSTGNPEEDQRIIERNHRDLRRIIEGIRPNNCGPIQKNMNGKSGSHCPKCGFTTNYIYA